MQNKIVILCLVCLSSMYSQNTLNGNVVDEQDQPLSGSHIHVGSKTVTADALGKFTLNNVPNGKTKVFVSYVGYQSLDTIITISSNITLSFILRKRVEVLSEVKVKRKENTFNSSVLEQKVKTEAIERNSNQTLGDALKSVTGVTLLKTGSSIVKPVVNGLHSNRVPIINNNVRLEDQQWGAEHSPNFDINSAGKITVIKGASGLQFGGDAIGGMILIEPISVKTDTLYGKTLLTMASNGRGGTISTSIHKGNFCDWTWNAHGSFKYLGDRETPNYVLSNSGNREANFSGDVKYIGKNSDFSAFYSFFNTTIGILSASHIGNATDLFNAIQNQEPYVVNDFEYYIQNPKQEVQHHLAKLNYNRSLNEESVLSLQYAFQYNKRFEYDVRRGSQNDKPALDLTLITHTINVDYRKEHDNWLLKTGAVGTYQNNFANPATDIRPLIPTFDKFDAGVYGIFTSFLSETLSLESGLRYDFSTTKATKFYLKSRWDEREYSPEYDGFIVGENESGNQWLAQPQFTFHNVSASVGIQKSFEHEWTLYGNASHAVRNPNPSEFFSDGLHHSTGMIELGDLKLQQEKSTKVAGALQKKWKRFSMSVNPFLNSVSNFMFLRPVGFETTIRGAFPVWEYQQTNALLSGVDLETQWNMNAHVTHFFSLAYVNGEDVSNNTKLIDMPPLNVLNKIGFSKKEWNQLHLELRSELVFRQHQFPDYNFSTNIFVDGQSTPVEVDISSPPAAYHLVHFYADVQLKTFKKTTTTLAFSVFNVFDSNYRDYLNRQRFFVDEMGRNIQLQLKINY